MPAPDVQDIMRAKAKDKPIDPALQRRWEYATQKVDRVLRSAEEPVSLEGPVGGGRLDPQRAVLACEPHVGAALAAVAGGGIVPSD